MDNGNINTSIDELKEYNIFLVNSIYNKKMYGGISYMGYEFDSSEETQRMIMTSVKFADMSLSGGFIWPSDYTFRDVNGNNVPMTAIQMVEFATTLFSFITSCLKNLASHKDSIEILTSIEDLKSYDVNTGWPVFGSTYSTLNAGDRYIQSKTAHIETYSFFSTTAPYKSKASTSYTAMSRFSYRGSGLVGAPTNIKAVAYCSQSTSNYSIRLQDVTNGVTIVEKNNLNNTSPEIIDLGLVSNIPNGESIFEVQVKSGSASNAVNISSLSLYL